MQLSPQTKATLLVIVIVSVAGCTTLWSDSTTDEFTERLDEAEPPSQLTATQENVFGTGDDEIELFQDVWLRETGESRYESTDNAEWVTVHDGEQLWEYYPDENRVVERENSLVDGSVLTELYHISTDLVTELSIDTVDETTFDGHDVYHVTLGPPANETGDVDESVLDSIREPFSPAPGADDAVASEPATPNVTGKPADGITAVELYFETEHLFPVKTVIETDDSRSETVYRDATFDPIADEQFKFDPPSDAVIEEAETPERTEFETLSEATEYANLSLTEPTTVPDEFERDSVSVTEWDERNETILSLMYQDDTGEFLSLTMTTQEIDLADEQAAESVRVGGSQGWYEVDETLDFHLLEWECNDYELSITAPDTVDRGTLFEMAESTACW